MAKIRFKRGTASDLVAAVAADQLLAGEPYLITDEERVSVGLGVDTYIDLAKMAAPSVVEGKRILSFYFSAPADGTIPLVSYATFAFNVLQVRNLKTASGTVTASFQINGTNITSLSGLSVTSAGQSPSASGANSVAAGNRLTLVLASGSTPVDLEGTLDIEVS